MIAGVVGQYRVLERIGSGGMGVVYKALDTRLNRHVAIKMLLDSTTLAGDMITSLRREALAIAAIDHPYICKVYELMDSQEQALLVMEFVEGETLAEKLSQGVLSIPETLRYAAEIAEALGEAHAKGIIHRDIKPSNIIITPHRHVKVMDFGIAKVRRDLQVDSDDTVTQSLNRRTFAGTPWYMSPEQALGRPLDHRTDIFSTGILIHQCLTGDLPFEGATRQAYLRNLTTQPPRPIRALAPGVPESLERAVLRCLEKEVEKRTASASELAADLLDISRSITGTNYGVPGIAKARLRTLKDRIVAGVVAVVLIASAWLLVDRLFNRETPPRIRSMKALITWPSREQGSRISPDGQWISFLSNNGGNWKIWLRRLRGSDPVPLEGQSGTVLSHVWSPDGNEMACLAEQEGRVFIRVLPAIFGGPIRDSIEIKKSQKAYRLIRWIGSDLYMELNESLAKIDLPKRSLETVTRFDSSAPWGRKHFDLSPDGKRIVFSAQVQSQEDLFVADVDGRNLKRVTDDAAFDRFPRWIGRQPRIVFQSNRSGQIDLWCLTLGSKKPLQITVSAVSEIPEDLSRDGLLLTIMESDERANLLAIDPDTGRQSQLTADALSDYWPSVSAASDRIVFQRSKPSVEMRSRLYDAQILVASIIPNGVLSAPRLVAEGFGARASRDGRWLAYLRWSKSDQTFAELWLHDLETQESRRVSGLLPLPGYWLFPVDWLERSITWSPAEPVLYFTAVSERGDPEIWKTRCGRGVEGTARLLSFERSKQEIRDPRISYNGRLLSYILHSEADLTSELRVNDLETGVDRILATWKGDRDHRLFSLGWLRDDSASIALFSQRQSDGTQRVEVLRATVSRGVRTLAELDRAFAATARLDPISQSIFLTREEGVAQNVFALSLPRLQLRRLTDNDLPSFTFSGIEFTREGILILSRVEQQQDIKLVQFEP